MMERTYIIPLRREWLRVPRWRRAKKCISAIRNFLKRHMKGSLVKISPDINLKIWEHGVQAVPSRIKVFAQKDAKGVIFAELFGKPVPKAAEKKVEEKVVEKEKEKAPEEKEKEKIEKFKEEVAKSAGEQL